MENKFFQEFLETGLFTIGDQDERLEHLQESIIDLQEKLQEDYTLIPKYVLVALDKNISEEDPVIEQTEDIVTKYWKTLRIKHSERPIQIHRGVILNALYNIGLENPIGARIVHLSASSYLPYASLGKEKSIIIKLINKLGEIAEEHAIKEWMLKEEEPSLRFSTLKMDRLSFGKASIDKGKLQSAMHTAIKNDPNSNRGSQNGGNTPWGKHFADKSSEGIANAFEEALSQLSKSFNSEKIEKPLNSAFRSFKKSIKDNLRSTFSSLSSVQRRSKLLWWKEALYSQSLNKSYREINSQISPIIMSVDLNNLLPETTPINVDYFLRETLYTLNAKEEIDLKFPEYLKQIAESKEILTSYFSEEVDTKGRVSFTDFVSLFVNEQVELKDFTDKTGLPEEGEINMRDLSVMILHDLLVKRLVKN